MQYTCPANKIAKINFNYATTLRSSGAPIEDFVIQFIATKKTSSPKFHSVIAIGKARPESSQHGQMLSLRPWWQFSEQAGNAGYSTGTNAQGIFGFQSSKYIEAGFTGSSNNLTTSPGDNVRDASPNTTTRPWAGLNGASVCDAHKDYIISANTQIYFQYMVVTNGSPVSNGNQVDISFEVEEMEAYA